MLSALRLCVWRFDNSYVKLFNINQTLSFTFGTKERKIFKNSIFSNFITGFIPTNGATDKVCFLHIFTLYPICHHSIHQHHTKHIRFPILHHLLTAEIYKTRQTEKSIFYHRLLFLSVKQSGYLFRSSQCSIKKKFQV